MNKRKSGLTLLFSILFLPLLNAQGTWTPIASGTTTTLLGCSAPTSTVCYVCGATGTIRKTINTGSTWAPQSSGTGQNLYSILFLDEMKGFVVGDNGTALKTTDGGTTWNPMTVGTTLALRYVYFTDTLTGYITGAGGLILKTVDAGANWNILTTGTGAQLSSVFFTTPTIGYSVGFSGTAIKTLSGGASWGSMTSGTSNPLGIVYFPTTTTGVATGDNGTIIRTTTSGTAWTPVTSGTTDNLTGMDFYDASNGVIVGGNVPLNTGIILTSTDAGASWTSMLPGTSRLTRVDFFDSDLGYAVGLDGTILQYAVPATPDATFTSTAPGCTDQGQNFYSIMTGTPGVTHSWNFGAGAFPASSTNSDPTGIIYSFAGAKVVTHIATTALGSDTSTMVININPAPSAVFTFSSPSCAGAPVDFNNFGTTGIGVTYSWDFGAGASPLVSTGENPVGITYSYGGSKTITFNVTNQYGCTTTSSQTISIDSLPTAEAGNDTTICYGTSLQIGADTVANMSYSWTPATSLNNASAADPIASPVAPLTQYIVTVTNTVTGCSSKDTVEITMLPVMLANAGSDEDICGGDSVQLGSGLILGQTYMWTPATGLSDSTSANPIAKPTGTVTYTLTVSANGCGSVTDEVTISVHTLPTVSAGMNDTITNGGSTQLNATGGILYVWSPAGSLDNPGIYNPMASPASTTTYTVQVTDLFGCKANAAVTVYVIDPGFWLPTAFTPDGYGSNDVFYVRGEGIQDFEFTIYNRWGERIFNTKDINTGWDGTRQSSGDKLPEGAYMYEIKGKLTDGTPVASKGIVNLIR